jgi:pimeloyl-ACP methyl ester carboxylesterase
MKPTLLLLHGALGSEKQFDFLRSLLEDKFQVVSFDFEGHGATPSDDAFTMELFAKNAFNFLHQNKIESTHIFGYSMGGYVALKMAQLQADKIQNIVTFGTKFDWTEESALKETRKLNPEIIEQKVPDFAAQLKVVHSANDWKIMMGKTAEMMMDLGKGACFSSLELEQIQSSITIGIGNEDKMVSIVESEAAVNSLPNGNLLVLDGFQHLLEKNDPNGFASFIRNSIFQG